MKLRIKIDTAQPWAGETDLDFERRFNGWDWHLVKEISGVTVGEFDDAFARVDWDLMVALTVVALIRDEKVERRHARECADLIRELVPMEEITFEAITDPEDDAGPPVRQPASEPGGSKLSAAPPPPSGPLGGNGGGSPDRIPSPTGSPG